MAPLNGRSRNRESARGGAGEGATEHRSERTPRCVSEGAEGATNARAVPRRADDRGKSQAETGSAAAKMLT